MPDWLITSRTILTAKYTDTHLEKNYRPIACFNTTYKLYTSILNDFLNYHCITNNVITVEQSGGKKGSWGCPDQLLINKMVLDEVRQYNRNIFTMWFDYQKAFDSIPHQWLFEALKLAKVPVKLTSMIETLGIWLVGPLKSPYHQISNWNSSGGLLITDTICALCQPLIPSVK